MDIIVGDIVSEQKTIKFKFSDLPDPVRKAFLLEVKNGEIVRKELSPTLKKLFVETESSSITMDFTLKKKDKSMYIG